VRDYYAKGKLFRNGHRRNVKREIENCKGDYTTAAEEFPSQLFCPIVPFSLILLVPYLTSKLMTLPLTIYISQNCKKKGISGIFK
jgi:hypothetical protein